MEEEKSRFRKFLASEHGLFVEACIALFIGRAWVGFEIAALVGLAFVIAVVVRMKNQMKIDDGNFF